MTKDIKLAIFDMDGTILDTLEDLADAVNHTLKQYGYPTHTLDEIKSYIGYGMKRLLEQSVPADISTENFEKFYNDYMAYYMQHSADKTKPYDGIKETILELRNNGIITAVVSNKMDSPVQDLAKLYFSGLFDYAVGERPGIRRKPEPDSVLAVLDKFKIKKENAVYIGDSEVDYQTAKNAGVTPISVTWGFREKAYLSSIGATNFANKPDDIVKYVINP